MSTLSRIIIVLLLLLSIAALIFGLILFNQRENIKGQVLRHRKNVHDIANYIENDLPTNFTERGGASVSVSDDDMKRYYQLAADGSQIPGADGQPQTIGPGTLSDALSNLVGKVAVQYDRLNETRAELKRTQDELTRTKEELEKTKAELEDARKTIKEQAEKIATLEAKITSLEATITQLTAEKTELEAKVKEQTEEIAKIKDERDALQKSYINATNDLTRAKLRIKYLENPGAEGKFNPPEEGLQGYILVVNTNYNFVVIDIPEFSLLNQNVPLKVNRGERLIGHVIVDIVRSHERFAICNIEQPDSVKEAPTDKPQVGDTVFY